MKRHTQTHTNTHTRTKGENAGEAEEKGGEKGRQSTRPAGKNQENTQGRERERERNKPSGSDSVPSPQLSLSLIVGFVFLLRFFSIKRYPKLRITLWGHGGTSSSMKNNNIINKLSPDISGGMPSLRYDTEFFAISQLIFKDHILQLCCAAFVERQHSLLIFVCLSVSLLIFPSLL